MGTTNDDPESMTREEAVRFFPLWSTEDRRAAEQAVDATGAVVFRFVQSGYIQDVRGYDGAGAWVLSFCPGTLYHDGQAVRLSRHRAGGAENAMAGPPKREHPTCETCWTRHPAGADCY